MTNTPKHMLRGGGRVAFLARKEAIRKMIDAGYPLFSVFKEYESEMSISYSQFTRYVNKLIRSKPTNENHGEKANEPTKPAIEERRERSTGFTLDTDTSAKRRKNIL